METSMNPYHCVRYLISTGRVSLPVLLLTTMGRKTGQSYTWPLNYYPYSGDSVVVVASNRGQPGFPQWYRNLLARPEATIQRGARRIAVIARVATSEEADRLWPILTTLEPLYLRYRTMTDREFPLVILTPR